MADDFTDKISMIANLLSGSNKDALKDVLGKLTDSGGSKENTEITENELKPVRAEVEEVAYTPSHEAGNRELNDIADRLKRAADKISYQNDPRVNLLSAISPFLSNHRKDKIQHCIKLIRLTGIGDAFK